VIAIANVMDNLCRKNPDTCMAAYSSSAPPRALLCPLHLLLVNRSRLKKLR
jgi:hypothetical protein